MSKYASKIVEQAIAWLGFSESSGKHKQIIDVYNAHRPLARGYKVKYTDAWCATFVSAVAIKVGYTDIIPTECGCGHMRDHFIKMGAWAEDESRTPNPGDIVFYDWEDNGVGDNRGGCDHVGIVEKVVNGKITVIEGNYSNSVKRRTLSVNGRYIRGYGVPKYDPEATNTETKTESATSKGESTVNITLNVLKKGAKGEQVKAVQRMLYSMGYDLGASKVDGDFGSKTDAAVRAYQKKRGLTVDGVVGQKTWAKFLKG